MIARIENPFICPSLPHEISGQYKAGTTCIEGLVYFTEQMVLKVRNGRFYGRAGGKGISSIFQDFEK